MRVERRGEHLDVASPLALATVLADLDLVATLVHAEQAAADRVAFGVIGLDLESKIQCMSRLKKRGLSHRRSSGRRSCCNFQVGGSIWNCYRSSCILPIGCIQSAVNFHNFVDYFKVKL